MVRGIGIAFCIAASACATSKRFESGKDAARDGDWDGAVRYYQTALDEDPDNVEYRMALQNARLEASRSHKEKARKHVAADELEAASVELELALAFDPTNRYLAEELSELRRTSEDLGSSRESARGSPIFERRAILDASSSEPIRLYFPEGTSLRTVLETLAKLSGVNILFDESFRDKQISVDLEGVTFQQALDILMQTNGLFYKVVGPSYVVR